MTPRPAFAGVLRRAIWPLLIFAATIELATLVLLDPVLVLLLERAVALGGDRFVGNTALISFVLSPAGIAAVAVAAIGSILLNVLAFGGISLILWGARQGFPLRHRAMWHALLGRLPALLAIGAGALAALLLLAAPVLATAYLARRWVLSGGDFYFYLSTRPPEFLWAAAAVAVVAAAAGIAGLYLVLRLGLAVPICLLLPVEARRALVLAAQATRGRARALVPRLLGVAIGLLVLWGLILAALSGVLDWLLARQLPLAALHWAGLGFSIVSALAFAVLTAISRAAVVLVLLADRAAEDALPARAEQQPPPRPGRLRLAAALLLVAAMATVAAWETVRAGDRASAARSIAITAHRAGSARAPENTLAALEQAIADGADFVEIDVQETADGQVAVLHDTDLRRVAGVARNIWDMPLAEVQALDAGSWFAPRFHAERIPTLRAFALAARGRVRLNVELKDNGRGQDLAARVVAVLRETGVADQAVVSSLDARLLRQVRQLAPETKVGLILATGIGDLRSVDADFLALSSRLASPAVIRQLHASGREVHVWTLDDEAGIARAMLDGADNIITSDPLLAARVRDWFKGLNEPERMLLRIGASLETGWLRATGRGMTSGASADEPGPDDP